MRREFVITAICGNEERHAETWSKSMVRAKPKYIVINLTQYADKTEEILRANIPPEMLILVKNPWEDNFSTARNQCLDNVPDDPDIFWLSYFDLDETITEESYEKLEEILNSNMDPCLLLWNIYNSVQQQGLCASLFYPRQWAVYSKDGKRINARFGGRVHNQLEVPSEFGLQSVRCPLGIWHVGYSESPEIMRQKHLRSEKLLRAQISDEPKAFFPRLNLAQLLRAKGDHEGTLENALVVLDLVKERKERGERAALDATLMALDQVCTSLIAMKRYDEAIEHAEAALKIKPDYLDAIVDLSNAYLEKRDLEKAKFWLKRYLLVHSRYDNEKDNTNLILNHLNSSFLMLYHLGVVHAMEGDIQEATKYFKKSYDQQPDFRDSFIKFLNGLKMLNQIDIFNQEINKAMKENPDISYQIFELLADLELEMGNVERAKFNLYQSVHLGEGQPKIERIRTKWTGLTKVFGDVSDKFFDTNKKQNDFTKKIET